MADFRPETTIYLFEGTGVDDENQPYFTNSAAKMSWYMSHPTIQFTAQSYQRENRNYCRVNDKAERLRHCDMMAFRNGENKWILCRIDEIEFVNPNCSDISYTVDYMQTYIEDIKFGKCWVEREMQSGDWDGNKPSWNNLQPEGIETGTLRRLPISGDKTNLDLADSLAQGGALDVIVLSAYNESADAVVSVTTLGGLPTGLNAIKFSWPIDRTRLSNMLTLYSDKGKTDGIGAIFIGPPGWMDSVNGRELSATLTPTWNNVDGYEIINAKCFSSEFMHFELENGMGNSVEWAPELFTETDNIIIDIQGGFSAGGGGVLAYPRGYSVHPKSHGVVIPFNVQCAYITNAFSSWLAQNKASFVVEGASALQSGVLAAAATGFNPYVGVGAGLVSVIGSLTKIANRAASPLAIGGQSSGNGLNYTVGNVEFTPSLVCPYYENLVTIDSFFSRFGYRVNMYKYPNVNTRPKWNYVKTSDAVCRGWFSKKAQLEMERLMNNGVTFWHLVPGEEITDDWDPAINKE